MSANSEKSIYDQINKLYSSSGYMDKYGSDVWAAVIICIIFLLLTNYYLFANILEVVRSDWTNQKCNPLIIPFAGFINKPYDQSNLEFTASNFNNCVNSFLKSSFEIAIQPLYFAVNIIQESCNSLIEAVQQIRKLTKNLREQFTKIATQIYAAISNIMASFITFAAKLKDSMAKINAILTTALYTLFGSYMAAQSLFLSIIDLILIILIVLVVLIVLFWAIAIALHFIPFVGMSLAMPFGIKATIYTVIMIAILIPVIWFEIMMLRVMDLSTPPPPGVPGCFAGNTIVEMFDKNDNSKPIRDIKIGDKLKNGSKVTAVIQFSAREQYIYRLHNILVTGEHRVFHPSLKWIKVKDHPESVHIPDFIEPFVYCLNTELKSFTIGSTLFSDWDDIDDDVLEDLHKYCVIPGYLPSNFKYKDIHTHLDSGFHSSSNIVLDNGTIVHIKDVKVNDRLLSGDTIVGIVKIASHDMDIYKYSFNNSNHICGTKNIHINDNNLGIMSGMKLFMKSEPLQREDFMYHLLTDTKYFVVNNIRVHDYNSGIDKYLRQYN
jgi:hypothetical protein